MKTNTFTLLSALALVAVAVVAYLLWPGTPAPPPVVEAPVAAPAPLPPIASAPAAPASEPEVLASANEPVPEQDAKLPALDAADPTVKEALTGLVGKTALLGLLQTDGFVRRLVATADNLTRPHAASRLWPVNPTPGKFTVDAGGKVSPDNGSRYTAFVQMVESVEPARAAGLYRRLYPLLQQAYEELGYPDRRFHGRLLAVIDHLLATPQPGAPIAVTLTEVKGPIPSERPWVRYEFADPQLQALSSGQKIMLRVGEVNRRRLAGWLRQFRAQIER